MMQCVVYDSTFINYPFVFGFMVNYYRKQGMHNEDYLGQRDDFIVQVLRFGRKAAR